MKIGFVVDDTLDKPDGVQQYVLTLGKWLTVQGHEVHYIVGESSRTDIKNVHSVARNVPVSFNGNKLTVPLPARKRSIRRLLDRLELDIVHVQMPYSPFMAGRVIKAASKQTAVVGTFHILPYSKLERVATRALGILLQRTLRRFNAVFAVSEAARGFAESSFRVHADVLPNVIDVAAFRKTDTDKGSDKIVMAFLGRLVPRKGALELLRAVAMLPYDIRDRMLVRVAGKGALLPELKRFVEQNDLSKNVEFVGFVAEEDKPGFLAQATIAVFPSLGGESFGIVLIEAMAARSGVVMGGDNPGYRSVLGDWPETLVEPRDTAAFAEKLRVMADDVNMRTRLHAAQQTAIQSYDVAFVGAKWVQVYETALRARTNVR